MLRYAWEKMVKQLDGTVKWEADWDTARTEFVDAFTDGSVIRWKRTGRVPPADCLTQWHEAELFAEEVLRTSLRTRARETAEAIAQYCERRKKIPVTDEELLELRAAFGPGEVVVNVFTGKETRL